MGATRRVRVTIDLDIDAEPIGGELRRGDQPTEEFVGWLELAALLESVLHAGDADPPTRLVRRDD